MSYIKFGWVLTWRPGVRLKRWFMLPNRVFLCRCSDSWCNNTTHKHQVQPRPDKQQQPGLQKPHRDFYTGGRCVNRRMPWQNAIFKYEYAVYPLSDLHITNVGKTFLLLCLSHSACCVQLWSLVVFDGVRFWSRLLEVKNISDLLIIKILGFTNHTHILFFVATTQARYA